MTRRLLEVTVAPAVLVPGQAVPSAYAVLQSTRLPSGQLRRLQHHNLVEAERAARRALSRRQLTTLRLVRVTAVTAEDWDSALAAVSGAEVTR